MNLFNFVTKKELAVVELHIKQSTCSHKYLDFATVSKVATYEKKCSLCEKIQEIKASDYYFHNYTIAKNQLNNNRVHNRYYEAKIKCSGGDGGDGYIGNSI